MTTTGRVLMYGPEVWRANADFEWSCWDLWFAVLCVRDHGGDWDGLDAAITAIRHSDGEAKWSHLLDLRERLNAVGLGPDGSLRDGTSAALDQPLTRARRSRSELWRSTLVRGLGGLS